jgi:hypothetical protein
MFYVATKPHGHWFYWTKNLFARRPIDVIEFETAEAARQVADILARESGHVIEVCPFLPSIKPVA